MASEVWLLLKADGSPQGKRPAHMLSTLPWGGPDTPDKLADQAFPDDAPHRVVHLVQIQDSPLIGAPILDEKVHHEWATLFAAGEPWSVDRASGEPLPYFRAPLYVWFLGTVYRVAGVDPALAPRLVQGVLGALACGMVFLLGQRLFSRLR